MNTATKSDRDLWTKLRDRWLAIEEARIGNDADVDLSQAEESALLDWYRSAHRRTELQAAEARAASIVDLAAWCAFGSTDLDLLPREMRERDLEWAASRFSVQRDALVSLICSTSRFKVQIRDE